MARPMETQMTISCLQCEWSVEAVNTSVQESSAFLEAAYTHADQHEQHALEIVQRLRVYSENYVEPSADKLKTLDLPWSSPTQAYRPVSWTGPAESIEYWSNSRPEGGAGRAHVQAREPTRYEKGAANDEQRR